MPDFPDESELFQPKTERELLLLLRKDVKQIRTELADINRLLDKTAPVSDVKDHEKRIRTLEGFRWWILGGAAAAAFAGNLVAHFLAH